MDYSKSRDNPKVEMSVNLSDFTIIKNYPLLWSGEQNVQLIRFPVTQRIICGVHQGRREVIVDKTRIEDLLELI